MKTKEKKELQTKTRDELKSLLRAIDEEIFKLRLENFRKKLKNVSSISLKRKDKARIMTILREKELNKMIQEEQKIKV